MEHEFKIIGNNVLPSSYYSKGIYLAHFLLFECPGKCDFCILNSRGPAPKRKILHASQILYFWNTLSHIEGYPFSLIGGEPTLYPELLELINNLDGYYITISSNLGTAFYDDPLNVSKIPKKNLRINATFHPHFISFPRFIYNIKKLQDNGVFIGRIEMVDHPIINFKYFYSLFEKEGFTLNRSPLLGFYKDRKFPGGHSPETILKDYGPENLYPNETVKDLDYVKETCGIKDFDRYRLQCGAKSRKNIKCNIGTKCLLVSPDGKIFDCHYKLYYNIEPVTDIWNLERLFELPLERECNHFGFCSFCDFGRANFVIDENNYPKDLE